jgi:hypothetical protein
MRFLNYAGGAVLCVLGVVFPVLSFFYPISRVLFIVMGVVFLAVGGLTLWLANWTNSLTRGLPKPKGLGASFREASAQMAAATEMLKQQTLSDQLQQSGLPAQAQIMALRDTGQMINYNPVVEFDLLVTLNDRAPYPVRNLRQTVSKLAVGRLIIGNSYPARVDPTDHNRLFVSWM